MNRILTRPMFRIGGSAGTGITSGLNTPKRGLVDGPGKYSQDQQDRAQKTTTQDFTKEDIERALGEVSAVNREKVKRLLFPASGGLRPGSLPGFLTSFGLNLASATPTGSGFSGLLATGAKAAQQPFQTFQAAKLARADDEAKFKQDVFLDSLQASRDYREALAEAKGGTEFERISRANLSNAFYEGKIKQQENLLATAQDNNNEKEIAKIEAEISKLQQDKDNTYTSILSGEKSREAFIRDIIIAGVKSDIFDPAKVAEKYPELQDLLYEDATGKKDGGRIGYRDGTRLMESVVEQEKEQGEVQDLSYTQLRARLPNEISNEIVMLLANSKQALLDFANIQTTQDIQSFNQQYDVNLTLPQGA